MSFLSDHTPRGANKVSRYGWSDPGTPGEFRLVNKKELHVDHSYQRDASSEAKIARITREFNWRSFGVAHVAIRSDGKLFLFDGQHRVLGAMRRSDIEMIPCMVFPTNTIVQEAEAFLSVNTNRKGIGSIARHRASVAAGEPVALFVDQCLKEIGLSPSNTAKCQGQIRCLSICRRLALIDRDAFKDALALAAELSEDAQSPVKERILLGLAWVIKKMPNGIDTPRFRQRAKQKGLALLEQAMTRAAAFYTKGSSRVYGLGIMEEINKGLKHKFELGVEL